MARIQQFLLKIGILPNRLRFRQHMNNEMAHYAIDCWDAECETNHGWIECVGCADRSAYDLSNHSQVSGANLSAQRSLATPKEVDVIEIQPNSNFLKRLKSRNAKAIKKVLDSLSTKQQHQYLNALEDKG